MLATIQRHAYMLPKNYQRIPFVQLHLEQLAMPQQSGDHGKIFGGRLESIMLKYLPIIPSQTSQIFCPLFLFYSHSTTKIYIPLFCCVNDNITMQE